MLLSNSKESPVFRRGESQLQTPGVITYRTLIGQTFWSYDDPVTVWLKTAYVRLREPGGLGGAFVWALKEDRKSTRLNSSHITISYAVFCLKKKKINNNKHH